MAPALTSQSDKQPQCDLSPCRPRRIARTFTELLKSNLKNLLADCSGQPAAAARGHATPPPWPDMKHALGELCQPSVMDATKFGKDSDDMGLHSVNSQSLQELILSKKQLAESLAVAASSPPHDLADMMRELDRDRYLPPPGGNGDVPVDEARLVAELAAGLNPESPPLPPPPPEPAPPAPVASTPAAIAAVAADAEATRSRQRELEGRVVVLMRRLRALQARSARHQTSTNSQALLDKLSPAQPAAAAGSAPPHNSDIAAVLRSPDVKNFSTTQLVNLVLNNKTPSVSAGHDNGAVPSAASRLAREAAVADAARPAGVAAAQVARLLAAEDSDATESSSGGESGDEFDSGWDDCARDRAAPIRKRALWRWMSDRSAVASRWTWLTAQVTDLEFRIRQLRELHRQLRAARHPVTGAANSGSAGVRQAAAGELGGAGDASSTVAALRAAGKPDTGAGDASSAAVAALRTAGKPDAGVPEDGQCARTRPCAGGQRRRLVSVWRAPRRPPPAVAARCRCDPGSQSCATCAGRTDYLPRVSADTQPARERLAQLDPSCHPVLALPGEAPLSLGYDALLRSQRWQQNHLHARPRVAVRDGAAASLQTGAASQQSDAPVPTCGAAAAASQQQPVSTAAAGQHPVTRPSFHRRRPGVLKRMPEVDGEDELSLPPNPSSAPLHSRMGRPPKSARRSRSSSASVPLTPTAEEDPRPSALQRYRQRQQSYDIDNIVIPASMASTAKIEKPKYKEIVTPGWRAVELEPATVNGSGPDCRLEPLDDGTFERRHWQAELAERHRLYQSCQVTTLSGDGAGRGRRAHTPDLASVNAAAAVAAPAAAAARDPASGDAGRPRLLRYHHVQQPCGFSSRKFPLSGSEWQALLVSAQEADPSPVGWRSPASLTGSSTESAPEVDDHRRTAHRK